MQEFLTDLPVRLRWYKFPCCLLINFDHIENTTRLEKGFFFNMNPANACSKSAIIAKCETCSHLTIKTPERHHWGRSTVFIWTVFMTYYCTSVANFEQVIFRLVVFWIVYRERSYKHNPSKQDIFLNLIL